MSVSNPQLAWTAALIGAFTGLAQSTSLTGTFSITAGWEVNIPVAIRMSAVSADAVVNAYPSSDGGATYDSNPAFSITIARATGAIRQTSLRLPTGQYALQLLNSGPNSASFQVNTAMVVTAINIV